MVNPSREVAGSIDGNWAECSRVTADPRTYRGLPTVYSVKESGCGAVFAA